MSQDPIRKVFVRERVEYWVPTGSYDDDRDGADWHELMKAISWATSELKKAGQLLESWNEAGYGQLSILPHDEHVIVRLYLGSEVEKSA